MASNVTPFPGWRGMLLRNKKQGIRRAVSNVVVPLLHDPRWRDVLAFNELSGEIEKRKAPPWGIDGDLAECGVWTEADDTRLVLWLERELDGLSFGAATCRAAADNAARRCSYHPIREYLRGLKWDGEVRLLTWLRDYLGATQSDEYLAAVGVWWLVSAVARVERPGCQADHTLVLEGAQGVGKSTLVKILAGEIYSSTLTSTLGDKDSYQELRGKWIIEIAELAGMRRSDVERVKAYVAASKDTYRPSYARSVADFPRQCVFLCTTNSTSYLGDHTGARRFWPARCGVIDLARLAEIRDQLWAEAVARYDSGERWWPVYDESAILVAEQEERAEVDPWESVIAGYVAGRCEIEMSAVLGVGLNKDPGSWTRGDEARAGAILHRLGWSRTRVRRHGARIYLYTRPSDQLELPQ